MGHMALPTPQVTWHATSIGSVLLMVGGALLLFGFGFGILFWNEGRVDVSVLAQEAIPLNGAKVSTDPSLQGELVAVTGIVSAATPVGDDLFLEPEYLSVHRRPEKYVEGYWRTMADAVGEDFVVAEMGNAPERITVGAYTVGVEGLHLPNAERLVLTEDNVDLSGGAEIVDNYIFMGSGTLDSPEEGDVRISFTVIEDNFTGTVLGSLKNSTLLPYEGEEGETMYALYDGSLDDAMQTLATQDTARTWVIRIIGAILYWVAITALLFLSARAYGLIKPFAVFLTRFLLGLGAIPAALVAAMLTALTAGWAHSIVLSAVLTFGFLITLGVLWLRYVRRRQTRTVIPGR